MKLRRINPKQPPASPGVVVHLRVHFPSGRGLDPFARARQLLQRLERDLNAVVLELSFEPKGETK
jgi:hypothetical protein